MPKKLVPISEAAKLLGVSIQTLRRWAKAGKLTPSFVSPGGHRYYAIDELETYSQSLFGMAKKWVSTSPHELPPDYYCSTSSIFQARLSTFETLLNKIPDLHKNMQFSLVVSIVGEIGNNSFDHNLGAWPDTPGIFFGYDLNKRLAVIADRGLGVLQTLKRVRPSLQNDAEALRVAFTEVISGRAPEKRGNGLKFVKSVIMDNDIDL